MAYVDFYLILAYKIYCHQYELVLPLKAHFLVYTEVSPPGGGGGGT